MSKVESVELLVSVIIPTRKRPHLVTRAVRSALAQTLHAIEVIVVIDGPDDSTWQALQQMDDPRLKVVMLPRHSGCGYALNAGVIQARSQWIAFLDDDDEWLPEKLEIQLQTAQLSQEPYPIIACRLIGRSEVGDFVLPRRFKKPKEFLSEYREHYRFVNCRIKKRPKVKATSVFFYTFRRFCHRCRCIWRNGSRAFRFQFLLPTMPLSASFLYGR